MAYRQFYPVKLLIDIIFARVVKKLLKEMTVFFWPPVVKVKMFTALFSSPPLSLSHSAVISFRAPKKTMKEKIAVLPIKQSIFILVSAARIQLKVFMLYKQQIALSHSFVQDMFSVVVHGIVARNFRIASSS